MKKIIEARFMKILLAFAAALTVFAFAAVSACAADGEALPDGIAPENSERAYRLTGYSVVCGITKSTEAAAEGNITVRCTSDEPIEEWELSFESNLDINGISKGYSLKKDGRVYTVAPENPASVIKPHSSLSIAFAGKKAAHTEERLSYFKLTEKANRNRTGSDGLKKISGSNDIKTKAEYDEKSGSIKISWTVDIPENERCGHFEVWVSRNGNTYSDLEIPDFPRGQNELYEYLLAPPGDVYEYVYTPKKPFNVLFFRVGYFWEVNDDSSYAAVVSPDYKETSLYINAYAHSSEYAAISLMTSRTEGEFEIFASENGESFFLIGTQEAAENMSEYLYKTEEDFICLYFKARQTIGGKTFESPAERVINWDSGLDSDKDGLTDVDEIFNYDTDPTSPDTDGDGLPDQWEIFTAGTSPLNAYSYDDNISDGDFDYDEDGLTTLREYELGTYPSDEDSDNDGLSDGDEVNVYHTDPTNPDSDGDGVTDYEEITLGLDPNNPRTDGTDGTPDNERTFRQHIPADDWTFYNINTDSNSYTLTIDIKAAGVAEQNIYASFSSYTYSIQSSAVVGEAVEIAYEPAQEQYLRLDDIILNFRMKSSAANDYDKAYNSVSAEFMGIRRFNVFRFDEDMNMLLPVETFHDLSENRVYAHAAQQGTYCVIDMTKLLDSFGITPEILLESGENNFDEITVFSANLTPLPEDYGEIRTDSGNDYDSDGLTDVTEYYLGVEDENGKKLAAVNEDGSVILPSLCECAAGGGKAYEKGLDRFFKSGGGENLRQCFDSVKLLPINSYPTRKDSDGDGITDETEYGYI